MLEKIILPVVMNAPECTRFERSISVQRAGMLKKATDQRCECCGDRISSRLLELHCSPGMGDPEQDPVSGLLILCPACHASMHDRAVPEREQRLLVEARPSETEQRIRKVFGPKPYLPPDSSDPEELFASALSSPGMDLFLNGA